MVFKDRTLGFLSSRDLLHSKGIGIISVLLVAAAQNQMSSVIGAISENKDRLIIPDFNDCGRSKAGPHSGLSV